MSENRSYEKLESEIAERERAENELKQTNKELSIRNRISEIFLTIPDEEMYGEVLRVILETTDSKYGVFGYIDENGAYVVPSMTRHVWDKCQVPDKDIVFPREKWGDSIWPRAIRQKETLHSNERSTLTPRGHIPIRRNVTVPVIHQGEVIGLFQVANKATDYDEKDIRLSETIADIIAPVLNARLQRDRQEKMRRQAEAALRENEERFRATFEAGPIGMAFVGPDHRFVKVNKALCEMLGYAERELAALTFADVTHPDDVEIDRKLAERVFKGEIPRYGIEKRYVAKNGEVLWVNLSAAAIRDHAGNVLYKLEMVENITHRKRAEEAMMDALKSLEAFSYSVSHDLRSPLRAINGFSNALLEDHAAGLNADAQRYLNLIRTNALNMGRLIDDLLSFSRFGRQKIRVSDIDMEKLARAAFDELERANPGRPPRLDISPLPRARGDYSMIRQVFFNLLSNAIKFTGAGDNAIIEIGGVTEGNENVYYVKDNGVGFDMRYADKLFGVFQRLHSAAEFEGTGVGLAIVQRIIHRHDGRVWADGKENEGATFYFTLPIRGRDL